MKAWIKGNGGTEMLDVWTLLSVWLAGFCAGFVYHKYRHMRDLEEITVWDEPV